MTATKRLPPKSPNVEQPPAKKQHTSFPSFTTNAFPCATRVDASSLSSSTPTDDAHYLSGKVIKRDFAGGTFNIAIRLTEGGKKDLARLRMMGDLVRKAKDTPLGNLNQQTTLQISLRGSRWETDEAGLLIGIWDEEVKMQVQGKLFELKTHASPLPKLPLSSLSEPPPEPPLPLILPRHENHSQLPSDPLLLFTNPSHRLSTIPSSSSLPPPSVSRSVESVRDDTSYEERAVEVDLLMAEPPTRTPSQAGAGSTSSEETPHPVPPLPASIPSTNSTLAPPTRFSASHSSISSASTASHLSAQPSSRHLQRHAALSRQVVLVDPSLSSLPLRLNQIVDLIMAGTKAERQALELHKERMRLKVAEIRAVLERDDESDEEEEVFSRSFSTSASVPHPTPLFTQAAPAALPSQIQPDRPSPSFSATAPLPAATHIPSYHPSYQREPSTSTSTYVEASSSADLPPSYSSPHLDRLVSAFHLPSDYPSPSLVKPSDLAVPLPFTDISRPQPLVSNTSNVSARSSSSSLSKIHPTAESSPFAGISKSKMEKGEFPHGIFDVSSNSDCPAISEIKDRSPGTYLNIIGIGIDWKEQKRTGSGSWLASFTLIDHTNSKISVSLFNKRQENLPKSTTGSIVLLRGVRKDNFKDDAIQLKGLDFKDWSFVQSILPCTTTFPSSSSSSSTSIDAPPAEFLATPAQSSRLLPLSPYVKQYCDCLKVWGRRVFKVDKKDGGEAVVQLASKGGAVFRSTRSIPMTIGEVAERQFFNAVVQIVRIVSSPGSPLDLYVTDFTSHSSIAAAENQYPEMDGKQTPTFPFGQYVLKIAVFGTQDGLEQLEVGMVVQLRNVKPRFRSGDLEGGMEHLNGNGCGCKKLLSDSTEAKALFDRRTAYYASMGEKTKDVPPPERRKQHIIGERPILTVSEIVEDHAFDIYCQIVSVDIHNTIGTSIVVVTDFSSNSRIRPPVYDPAPYDPDDPYSSSSSQLRDPLAFQPLSSRYENYTLSVALYDELASLPHLDNLKAGMFVLLKDVFPVLNEDYGLQGRLRGKGPLSGRKVVPIKPDAVQMRELIKRRNEFYELHVGDAALPTFRSSPRSPNRAQPDAARPSRPSLSNEARFQVSQVPDPPRAFSSGNFRFLRDVRSEDTFDCVGQIISKRSSPSLLTFHLTDFTGPNPLIPLAQLPYASVHQMHPNEPFDRYALRVVANVNARELTPEQREKIDKLGAGRRVKLSDLLVEMEGEGEGGGLVGRLMSLEDLTILESGDEMAAWLGRCSHEYFRCRPKTPQPGESRPDPLILPESPTRARIRSTSPDRSPPHAEQRQPLSHVPSPVRPTSRLSRNPSPIAASEPDLDRSINVQHTSCRGPEHWKDSMLEIGLDSSPTTPLWSSPSRPEGWSLLAIRSDPAFFLPPSPPSSSSSVRSASRSYPPTSFSPHAYYRTRARIVDVEPKDIDEMVIVRCRECDTVLTTDVAICYCGAEEDLDWSYRVVFQLDDGSSNLKVGLANEDVHTLFPSLPPASAWVDEYLSIAGQLQALLAQLLPSIKSGGLAGKHRPGPMLDLVVKGYIAKGTGGRRSWRLRKTALLEA